MRKCGQFVGVQVCAAAAAVNASAAPFLLLLGECSSLFMRQCLLSGVPIMQGH